MSRSPLVTSPARRTAKEAGRGVVCAALLLLALPSPPVRAEEPDAAAAQDPDAPVSLAPAAGSMLSSDQLSRRDVSSLDADDLSESPAITLSGALLDMPGVFIRRTGRGGGAPVIRGQVGAQNLILVDGVRLNNSVYRAGAHRYLDLLAPRSLARVEVLRGPGSILHGADAMGGVIRVSPVLPRDYGDLPDPGYGGRLRLNYRTADQGKLSHGELQSGYGGLGILGSTTVLLADDLAAGRQIGNQPDTAHRDVSVLAHAVYRFSDGWFAGWRWQAVYLMSNIIGAERTDRPPARSSVLFHDTHADLVYSRLHMPVPRLRTTGEVTLSYQHFSERLENLVRGAADTPSSSIRDRVTAHTLGVDARMVTSLVARTLRFRYGGLYYRDWVSSEQLTRRGADRWTPSAFGVYPDGSVYENFGAYLMMEGDLLLTPGHILRIGAGYRFQGMSSVAPARLTTPGVEFSHFGNVFQGSLQYLYRNQATVAFNFSQGFKAPSLHEVVMFGDTGRLFHVPNYDLSPRRIDAFELLMRAGLWRITAAISAHVSVLHDPIKLEKTRWSNQAVIGGKDAAWHVNGGDGILWGLEAELKIRLPLGLTLQGGVAHADGEELVQWGDNLPLSGVPPLFGQLKLRYETRRAGSWRGFVQIRVRGAAGKDLTAEEQLEVQAASTPAWWTFGLDLGLALSRVKFGLTVDNMLDADYRYHGSGVFEPGTSAMLTMEAAF